MITLTLPIPPSVNAMYGNRKNRTGKQRGRFKTNEYVAWIEAAKKYLIAQRVPQMRGPLKLSILVPTDLRGDVSNRVKAVEDLLVRCEITGDDRHNKSVTIEHSSAVTECVVRIEPYKPASAIVGEIIHGVE